MGYRKGVLVLAAAGLLAGCASDVTTSEEYVAVASARDAAASERDRLASELAAREQEADQLAATVDDQRAEIAALTDERDAARDEVEQLRLAYDDEIRAELLAAFDAEAARACDEAKADIDAPVAGLVDYRSEWEPVGTRAELVEVVTDCAADERAKTAAQREAERLAACAPVDVDAVVKDPDAFRGTCVVLYAAIWQYDSRTGPCNFLAAMSDRSHGYRYQYGEDAAFVASEGSSCPSLEGIDADDHVKVWATGMGPYRYDTAMGGTNEIPLWSIEKVELVRKE